MDCANHRVNKGNWACRQLKRENCKMMSHDLKHVVFFLSRMTRIATQTSATAWASRPAIWKSGKPD